jgi:hypothetical protein
LNGDKLTSGDWRTIGVGVATLIVMGNPVGEVVVGFVAIGNDIYNALTEKD